MGSRQSGARKKTKNAEVGRNGASDEDNAVHGKCDANPVGDSTLSVLDADQSQDDEFMTPAAIALLRENLYPIKWEKTSNPASNDDLIQPHYQPSPIRPTTE